MAIKKNNAFEVSYSNVDISPCGNFGFFFAGEEISWGQSYFFWKTPQFYRGLSLETNLHNSPFPIHTLGGIYLIMFFIIVPVMIRFDVIKIPNYWFVVLPERTVIFNMIYAFLWKIPKIFLHLIYPKDVLLKFPFYSQFIEQINEQKEMLIAITLLIYAFYVSGKVNNIHEKPVEKKQVSSIRV